MVEGVIYMYEAPNGKKYIGQTTNENNRKCKFSCLTRIYSGQKFENARLKYGPDKFKYKVLMRLYEEDIQILKHMLDELECAFITIFNTIEDGYNSTEGGKGSVGYHLTDEQKKHISEIQTGRKQSSETIEKRVFKLKGTKRSSFSQDWRDNIGKSKLGNKNMLGHHHSDESKEKNRQSHLGKGIGEDNPFYGKKHSDETRKKMSEKAKGRIPWNKGKKKNQEKIEINSLW